MTSAAPDIEKLRENAIAARDGALIGGVRTAPYTFCTVHWQTMLTLLDATTQPRIHAAHLTVLAEHTAAELNHAIAHNHERTEILRLAGRLVREMHALTERPNP